MNLQRDVKLLPIILSENNQLSMGSVCLIKDSVQEFNSVTLGANGIREKQLKNVHFNNSVEVR